METAANAGGQMVELHVAALKSSSQIMRHEAVPRSEAARSSRSHHPYKLQIQ